MGRPAVKMPEQFGTVYEEWKRGMITAQKAMKVLGLSRSTFYRMVRVYDEQGRVKKSEDFDI